MPERIPELTSRQYRLVSELVQTHAERLANRRKLDWSYDMAPKSTKAEWAHLAEEWRELSEAFQPRFDPSTASNPNYCEPGKSLLIESPPNTPEWEHELVAGIHLHPEEPG